MPDRHRSDTGETLARRRSVNGVSWATRSDSSRARARPSGAVVSNIMAITTTLVVLVMSAPLRAQGMGAGFFFKEPVATLALRGGFGHASARSDVFSFIAQELTVDRGDFSGFTVGSDLALRVSPRLEVVLGASYASSRKPSEYRDFVDQDDLPIEQTTSFRRVPLTASLKASLSPRGRSIGRFAWIPARFVPYLGGGGGAMWYRLRQSGDFIDADTRAVFSDVFRSSGWAPEAHAMAGIDVSLSPRWVLTGEGRYTWASANMSDDFVGFEKIDLSGFAITAGLAIRF